MEISFRPTLSDPCVYIYRKEGSIAEEGGVILTLYVDDILLSGKDEELKGLLMQRYDMRDMGQASKIQGIEVSRDRKAGTISTSQGDYVRTILQRYDMENCNPSSTPGSGPEIQLDQPEDKLLKGARIKEYQALVCLLYTSPSPRDS